MSKWNYRVMRRVEVTTKEVFFAIYGVHYKDGTEDVVDGWDTEPTFPIGDDPTELKVDMARMLGAFKKPVLDYETGKVWEGWQ